ncbi:hypothetical protein CcrKarma_gp030 [Caulobacter virus Karma]|uniref:hypothetical protein n=1 Tax=Caulobacter virus Karma TaxID=1211641 RepID=UPI00028AA22E|nr:hypothetical protein CcrKarma_gp030 [Caulobacter virus Karma]AFU87547.1 hypothetical protein CcrKarma_gp030 [Caulobacter virus Karma]
MSKSTPSKAELMAVGERKHETCRYGRLTEMWTTNLVTNKETAGVAPLCTFDPPGDLPPALKRVWGGIIDLDRDCAVCLAHREVPLEPLP